MYRNYIILEKTKFENKFQHQDSIIMKMVQIWIEDKLQEMKTIFMVSCKLASIITPRTLFRAQQQILQSENDFT